MLWAGIIPTAVLQTMTMPGQQIRKAGSRTRQGAATHPHDAWQRCHIGDLLDGREETTLGTALCGGVQLVEDERLEAVIDVELARHPHAGHHALLDAEAHRRLLLNILHLLQCYS